MGSLLRLALGLLEHRVLDEHLAKKIFSGETAVRFTDEFYVALHLLPLYTWAE
jgi:hypothetical protein